MKTGVTYHQAEERDYQEISDFSEREGWNTSPEDAKYLCSFLPTANHVARSGGKVVGLYIYENASGNPVLRGY